MFFVIAFYLAGDAIFPQELPKGNAADAE